MIHYDILFMQVTVDIPYASPPQGMKYFTIIGPHIDCMDEHYLVSFCIFIKYFLRFYIYIHIGKIYKMCYMLNYL